MRIFIRHKQGEIIAVCKATVMSADLDHPFADVADDEEVVEIAPDGEASSFEAHEIVEQCSVDASSRQLRKRRQ